MQISDEGGRQPWWRAIRRVVHQKVCWEIGHPRTRFGVNLNKVWVTAPILMLVDARIDSVHPCDVANNSSQICKVPSDLVVRVVAGCIWTG